ncbi:hypothetical protein GCM10027176_17820 [Actinoallomurus bryophytorum]|uniref:Excisionase family DNA binding protein n=1 Tax=Actinoallomurus bryophytorum TaxID=1490222 RepID=A0A543CLG1_9ACTN|nr:helix-turn-helix domain-containing protein [Actinoallomurus bryophytorum]TQL97929.1 excisionase family DNA binding protein [Actinoallomurus bryophytorum]
MSALDSDDDLLRPREAAEMLGVRSATIGFWARTGVLRAAVRTPGGQRRYRRADIRAFGAAQAVPTQMEADAVRLYEQGWPIRRVAAQFGCGYSRMRRILLRHTRLRTRWGPPPEPGTALTEKTS